MEMFVGRKAKTKALIAPGFCWWEIKDCFCMDGFFSNYLKREKKLGELEGFFPF